MSVYWVCLYQEKHARSGRLARELLQLSLANEETTRGQESAFEILQRPLNRQNGVGIFLCRREGERGGGGGGGGEGGGWREGERERSEGGIKLFKHL